MTAGELAALAVSQVRRPMGSVHAVGSYHLRLFHSEYRLPELPGYHFPGNEIDKS